MATRTEETLVAVSSLQVGDEVRTSTKAKPRAIVKKEALGREDVRFQIGAEVRTYHQSERIIKVTKVQA